TRLVLSLSNTALRVGSGFSVTITAQDAFGNRATSNDSVALNSSNAAIVSSTTVTLVNGQGVVSLTPRHSGTATLTATTGSLSSSTSITVSPSLYTFTYEFRAWVYINGQEANIATMIWSIDKPDVQAANLAANTAVELWRQTYYPRALAAAF